MRTRMVLRATAAAMASLVLTALATACGGTSSSGAPGKAELRLGYFPNITHASALLGVEKGIFAKHLGGGVALKTQTFNAGPAAVEALFSGAIDATYVGPNPAINAWSKSKGKAIKIISGATSGGAALVVKPEIKSAAELKGKKIATPQLGNTQDVALRFWLKQQGLKSDPRGGGDVSVVPQENSQTLQTFATGDVDGAWVPEPYASRLVLEGKGSVLVDEKKLWPQGRFVTTQLVVRTEFLNEHPDLVKKLLEGQVEANAELNKAGQAREDAAKTVNAALQKITGKALKPDALDRAFGNLTFTNDPIATSLKASADHAVQVGLLKPVDLGGIYDLRPLNGILQTGGERAVSDR